MEMSTPTNPMAPQPSANTNSNNTINLAPPSLPQQYDEHDDANDDDNDALSAEDASKIQNLKFVNATSYLLTGMMVTGVVLFKAREEGVFGDEFLWMKYQTLLTPSSYVNLLWIPVFVLQGLFVYASTLHETLQRSPLVGYDRALRRSSRTSVAVHYPAVCAATLLTVYSHDYGHVFLALSGSVLCGIALTSILQIQGRAMNEMEAAANAESGTAVRNVGDRTAEYAALRLPFELHGGYVLALVAVYFNTFLAGFDSLPTSVFLAAANASLGLLLCAGFYVLWVTDRKFYGVGVGLVWYLLGVAIELHAPTQPIYNEFSDGAILTTQIVAGMATLILATLLGVRVMKTMIKHNLFNCGDALDKEGEISTDYVHA